MRLKEISGLALGLAVGLTMVLPARSAVPAAIQDKYQQLIDLQKAAGDVKSALQTDKVSLEDLRKALIQARKGADLLQKEVNGLRDSGIDYGRYSHDGSQHRCPNGEDWWNCNHESIKEAWLHEQQTDLRARLFRILDDKAKRDREINDSLADFNRRMSEYDRKKASLEKDTQKLLNDLANLKELIKQENARNAVFPKESFGKIASKLAGDAQYQPTADGTTRCNYFVRDFAKQLTGTQPPELDGKANDQFAQLSKAAADKDSKWRSLSFESSPEKTFQDAQGLANQGKLVIVAWNNPAGPGHVAVVVPQKGNDQLKDSTTWKMKVPYIAQAGSDVLDYAPLSEGFGSNKKKGMEIFVFDPGK